MTSKVFFFTSACICFFLVSATVQAKVWDSFDESMANEPLYQIYLLQKTDPAAAISKLNKLIEETPNYGPAYSLLGHIYERDQDVRAAENAYKNGIAQTPVFIPLYSQLGDLYLDLQQYDKAEQEYRNGLKLNPNDVDIHDQLAYLYTLTGKYSLAEEEYQQCLKLSPGSAHVYEGMGFLYENQKMFDKAKEFFLKALEIEPEYAMAYNDLGVMYRDMGEFDLAIENYNKAIELDKEQGIASVYAHENLSALYATRKQFREAEEEAEKIKKHKIDYAKALRNIGMVYGDSKIYPKAIEILEKSIELFPEYLLSNLSLARVCYESGDFSRGLEVLKKLEELAPKNPEVPYWEAEIYAKMKRAQDACDMYKKAIELAPNDKDFWLAVAYEKYGAVLLTVKRDEQAAENFKKVIEIDPVSPYSIEQLGKIYEKKKKYSDAAQMYEKLVKYYPDRDPEFRKNSIYITLSSLYLKQRMFDQSIEAAKKAISLNPNNFIAYGNLVEAYRASGQKVKAEEIINKVSLRNPTFRQAMNINAPGRRNANITFRILLALGLFFAAIFILYKAGGDSFNTIGVNQGSLMLLVKILFSAALVIAGIMVMFFMS